MENLKKLLVIVDPDNDSDFVIERAILLAFYGKAQVLLIMNKANVLPQNNDVNPGLASRFFRAQKQSFLEHYQNRLAALKTRFETQGIDTETFFSAEKNDAAVILEKIREFQPDMTLKSVQKKSALSHILITNTDWKLVRNCPSPLLLVKARPWFEDGAVLSAVDPLHSKAQQNQLDHLLLDTTVRLARSLQLSARVFHCYFPDLSSMFPKVVDAEAYVREVRAIHWDKIKTLVSEHGVSEDQVTMTRGDLIKTLLQTIRKDRANILVLGALSRNAVESAIIGSTAEKILYDTPCDVLIMKHNR
ncbi:MAG: universal stress protein [Pseudohongiella sp.]|uniref:universal stress protein n=1 Tax=Pseudohongiella sp. TaxID=1979412 RepID=UPI0034A05428